MEDVGPLNNRGWGTNAEAMCGMVHFTYGEEDLLYVVGGWGHAAPSSPQHGAQYQQYPSGGVRTNEQHIFSLSTSEWYCVVSV